MKARTIVLVAGLGYLFGTRSGRERLDQAKDWATRTWNDPKVQAKVDELSTTAAKVAKDQGSAIADKFKSATVGGTSGTSGTSGTTGTTGTNGTGTVRPTSEPPSVL